MKDTRRTSLQEVNQERLSLKCPIDKILVNRALKAGDIASEDQEQLMVISTACLSMKLQL